MKVLDVNSFNEVQALKKFLQLALFNEDNVKTSNGPALLKTLEYLQLKDYDSPASMRKIIEVIEQYHIYGIDYDIQILSSL